MYTTLSEIKKQCNIDADWRDDDSYLISLGRVAEDSISKHINQKLEDTLVEGELPMSIKQAILLLVANLYANREPVSYSTVVEVPYTLDYLLGLNINYQKTF